MTITMAKTYNELLLETQPQEITTDAENEINLAHIERLMSMENLTLDEKKILDLLLLLSEHFEGKAYPMNMLKSRASFLKDRIEQIKKRRKLKYATYNRSTEIL